MQNLMIKKASLSVTSTLVALLLIATTTSSVHADVSRYSSDGDNEIRVYYQNDDSNKVYQVNGKTFYWHELNNQQQSRLKAVEDKMARVEKALNVQEIKLNKFAKQIQTKAKLIQQKADKIEKISVDFHKDKVTLSDLHTLAAELEKLSSINEGVLAKSEFEMEQLEHQMDKVDLSMVNELEQHAREFEQVLVAIAEEI